MVAVYLVISLSCEDRGEGRGRSDLCVNKGDVYTEEIDREGEGDDGVCVTVTVCLHACEKANQICSYCSMVFSYMYM